MVLLEDIGEKFEGDLCFYDIVGSIQMGANSKAQMCTRECLACEMCEIRATIVAHRAILR